MQGSLRHTILGMTIHGLAIGAPEASDGLISRVQLAVDKVNTEQNEIAIAFNQDATEFWLERRPGPWGASGYRSAILYSRWDGSEWQTMRQPEFVNNDQNFGAPFFDDATSTLYFTSDTPSAELPNSASNIWRIARTSTGWSLPEILPAPVNGAGAECSPVYRNGHLYFASYRNGDGDIYCAWQSDQSWQVSRMGDAINSSHGEWNVWVSPAEDLILFEASGRATNVSNSGDLYRAIRNDQGGWQQAKPLTAINSSGSELHGHRIGPYLLYTTTISGNADISISDTSTD